MVENSDLMMGAAYYRTHLNILTGWIHHVVYVLIVQVVIKRSWTQIFCLCASMEVSAQLTSRSIQLDHSRRLTSYPLSFSHSGL
jgi:hypothetical protein